jgi:predicted thioesterase
MINRYKRINIEEYDEKIKEAYRMHRQIQREKLRRKVEEVL